MKQLVTEGIVLTRTDYGEADRIVTLLTPDYGKLSLMARGVRRPKSKLAGGIELFSVSQLTFIRGRGDLGTLISIRLNRHYGNIVSSIERVQLGYDLIRQLHRATEDAPEVEYFTLLKESFAALDETSIDIAVIRLWFNSGLLRLGGHSPNLRTDADGRSLKADDSYVFDIETMSFRAQNDGPFSADHIKFLRLVYSGASAKLLGQVQNAASLATNLSTLTQTMLAANIRL